MSYWKEGSAIVDEGAAIGEGSKIWHFTHVCSGARVGKQVSLGQGVFVGGRALIGDRCKIQNHVSVFDEVLLEEDVFVGPHASFTNVLNPRAPISRKQEYRLTWVERGATIGANATILPGVRIGQSAFIGAGAVVTQDVPAYALMVGVPARQTGWMSAWGEKLELPLEGEGEVICEKTGTRYRLQGTQLSAVEPLRSSEEVPGGSEPALEMAGLRAQGEKLYPRILSRMQTVLRSGQFIQGPEVRELETRLAREAQVAECISCGNGTDALLLALLALGVKAGDEVIVPAFTFIAPVEAVSLLGACPVFVDVDVRTGLICPEAMRASVNEKTRAVIAVSLYGQCADFDKLAAAVAPYSVPLIEDAAQSWGATYRGRPSCGCTLVACTSFFPSKPLGAYGDGGAIFTSDPKLAVQLRQLAQHGQMQRYRHVAVGMNSRLDTLQAAVLLEKLEIFPEERQARQRAAERYVQLFKASGLLEQGFQLPYVEPHNESVFAQFTIRVPVEVAPHSRELCLRRDALQAKLQKQGIPTAVHYPLTVPEQPAYGGAPAGQFPQSEQLAREVLSLPLHAYLSEAEQRRVVQSLSRAWSELKS